MEMIEVKTAELIGPALDWITLIADGWSSYPSQASQVKRIYNGMTVYALAGIDVLPSVSWRDGGPLIEKFGFCFDNAGEHGFAVVKDWYCGEPIAFYPHGKTHLIAACRAIVAAKLGDTVSVPKELMQ